MLLVRNVISCAVVVAVTIILTQAVEFKVVSSRMVDHLQQNTIAITDDTACTKIAATF